jgi:hypothetical protein
MSGTFFPETDTMAVVRVSSDAIRPSYTESFAGLRANADVRADIDRFRKYFLRPVDHTVELTLRTRELPVAVSNMLWGVNTAVDWNDGMQAMNWSTTG